MLDPSDELNETSGIKHGRDITGNVMHWYITGWSLVGSWVPSC